MAYAGGITSLSCICISGIPYAISTWVGVDASALALPVLIGIGAVGGVDAGIVMEFLNFLIKYINLYIFIHV